MPAHIVGDWGTSRLRLYRVENGVVADRCEGPGLALLAEPPAQALQTLLARWTGNEAPASITLCGMAGARTGLREAAYVACPADHRAWRDAASDFVVGDLQVRIAPGVRVADRDVMRGEETQIFGLLALHPELMRTAFTAVLPGTHSKWVRVEAGIITDFRTYFTGELYALLTGHSTLLKAGTTGADDRQDSGWRDGLARAERGGELLGAVFESRAAQLLAGRSDGWARGFLSGLLVGTEIADGRRWSGLAGEIVLIGAPELADRYHKACADRAIDLRQADGERCAIAGLELLDAHDR